MHNLKSVFKQNIYSLFTYIIYRLQNIQFTDIVVSCQQLIRKYACEELKRLKYDSKELESRAASCVSQRDIQVRLERVITS